MHPVRRLGSAAALAIVMATVVGCGGATVSSYVDRGADFAAYATYAWAADDRLVTGDPRLDNNPFFLRRLRGAVDHELALRGFTKTTMGPPDLIVHYHASVDRRLELGDEKNDRAHERKPFVSEAGTLVIDLTDARTNALVWRGWAEGTIDGVVDNQDVMERTVDEAAARILAQLPRRE
jgi:uncharacterized protein DUF4136